jgi:hypothetical protein
VVRGGQQPPFVRGGSILADGLLLVTDGNTKLFLVEPSPAGFQPLASAVILEPIRRGDDELQDYWVTVRLNCAHRSGAQHVPQV